jgi:O-antigen ligase
MPLPSRFADAEQTEFSRSHPGEPLAPADRLIVAQSSLLLIFSAWAGGGRANGVLPVMLAIAAIGPIALWLRRREREMVSLWPYVPLLLWLILFGVALLNPSYQRAPDGSWMPRTGWISWLPATADRIISVDAQLPWVTALLQGATIIAVRPHRRAVRYIWACFAINAFVLAVVGATFYFAHAEKMLGFADVPAAYFFATFYYKNHWAAYGFLGAVAGAALALRAWRRRNMGDYREGSVALFFLISSLFTIITLPLPGSRAGLLFTVVFVLFLLGTIAVETWRQKSHSRPTSWLAPAGLAVVIAAATLYGARVYAPRAAEELHRTERQIGAARDGAAPDLRVLVSRDTWRMGLDRPWFGWGIGSYELAFPLYQGNYLRQSNGRLTERLGYAHNDWLQMFAEAGIVGCILLLAPGLWCSWRAWRAGWPLGRIALGGCTLIAIYAWVDFPFNNPAILLAWTILLVGAAVLRDPAQRRT